MDRKTIDKVFMVAFRGESKGTLDPAIRKRIKRGIGAIMAEILKENSATQQSIKE